MTAIADTPARYGTVTRILHWGMALLFAWQFTSAALHALLPKGNALRETLWSTHFTVGTTLFLLVLIRGLWGLFNIPRRPEHAGTLGTFAVVGHVVIYALMVIVPFLKLLAAAGGTRPFTYLGVTIFQGNPEKITWMTAPAEFHGELGWVLAAVIAGHIAMATLYHGLMRHDGTLKRMAG